MKKSVFVVLFFLFGTFLVFNSCYHEYDELSYSSERLLKMEDLKIDHPSINGYVDAFGKMVAQIQEINATKDKQDLEKLIGLYRYALEHPERDVDSLIMCFNAIYTDVEIKKMENLHMDLNLLGDELKANEDFKSLTEDEKDLLLETLIFEFPDVKTSFSNFQSLIRVKTRSESTSSDCAKSCENVYYFDLIEIAMGSVCSMAVTIFSACASLGTMTIPALIALIVEAAGTSVAVDMATIRYKQCLSGCGG